MSQPSANEIKTEGERFVVRVTYPIPAMPELVRLFPAYVNPGFEQSLFTPIKACEGVRREVSEIECEYFTIAYDTENADVLAGMDRLGLRPALPEELIAFGEQYSHELLKLTASPLLALGAETRFYDERRVACLMHDERLVHSHGCHLRLERLTSKLHRSHRFLVVRK